MISFKSLLFQGLLILLLFLTAFFLGAETFYLDPQSGNDDNSGSTNNPLASLAGVAKIINQSSAPGPSIIKLAPGNYVLEQEVLFKNTRAYTREKRLIIEAAVMPDDPNWQPSSMPVILSVEIPADLKKGKDMAESSGFHIEINHVTIRGIKFLGNPVINNWYYSIYRGGKNLEDLEVSQCLFLGNPDGLYIQVPIIANGHSLKVDHCIFSNCRNSVVFWNAEGGTSRGNAMTYCIVDGTLSSGVWLCQTAEDFLFHHNIIINSGNVWIRSITNKRTYTISNCIISRFKNYSAVSGPNGKTPVGEEYKYIERSIEKTGEVLLEKGMGIDTGVPKYFMHVKPGTYGSRLGAGLFKTPAPGGDEKNNQSK